MRIPVLRHSAPAGATLGSVAAAALSRGHARQTASTESDALIRYAGPERPVPRVQSPFAVGDAQSLPVDPTSFDVAVAGLVLNFVPDSSGAVVEMTRAVRPGGAVAAYVWDYAGKMELMRYFWDTIDTACRRLLFSNSWWRAASSRSLARPTWTCSAPIVRKDPIRAR